MSAILFLARPPAQPSSSLFGTKFHTRADEPASYDPEDLP